MGVPSQPRLDISSPTLGPDEIWDCLFLLHLFGCSSEPLDNLKIQKVTFISEDEARKAKSRAANFPFFRYNLGPYSKVLANDVRLLEDLGFIDPETRQLTDRGAYILDYVSDSVKQSQAAQQALTILEDVCKTYRDVKSSALVDIVYEMTVAVVALDSRTMKVRDIPLKTDILDPEREHLPDFSVFSPALLRDLQTEFSMTPEDLDPDNPANVKLAREALDRALSS